MTISILCPTRNRLEALCKSVDSLVATTSASTKLEFLIAFDKDDESREDVKKTLKSKYVDSDIKFIEFDRLGYSGLHHYYNSLAELASGDWLLLWNDDALMYTQDWDLIVESFHNRFVLIATQCCTPGWQNHPGCMFPIIPKKWMDVVGRLSGECHVDSWIEKASQRSSIYTVVDIFVHHDHPTRTGNNNDTTYAEGVPIARNMDNFFSKDDEMTSDSVKIVEYLRG